MAYREQLIEKVKVGQLVLLFGLDLPTSATGLPSGTELAHGLAARWNLPDSDSLAEVAESLRQRNQQWKYAGYLAQVLPAGGVPGPLHRTIASMPLPFLMTAAYDDRLIRALKAADPKANLLVEDGDLTRRQFDHPDLIKLCGDLSRQQTLVVAEGEYANLLLDDGRRDLFERVGEWLAEKTVLLVGCDPGEASDFENQLYWEVLDRLGGFGAGGYLVWPGPSVADVARWAERGVTVIDVEPVAFAQSLSAGLEGVAIRLPEDKELVAIKELAQALAGAPSQAQVSAALDQLPPDRHPGSISMTFRFWLSDDAILQSILDVDYAPNLTHYHGKPIDTGITLRRLRNWAVKAAEVRRALEAPQDSSVEGRALRLFDAILPPDSEARERYALALRDRQMLNAQLHIVFELMDERGRLAPIPWELLHDGRVDMGRGFLGLNYPVYRLPSSVVGLEQIPGRIQRALIVAAEPTGKLEIEKLNADVDWICAALEKDDRPILVDTYRPTDKEVGEPETIKQLIRSGGYQLFHFVGHGLFNPHEPSRSKILLGRKRERGKELTAADLARVARESDSLVLVFLSACEVGLTDDLSESEPWEEAGIVDALIRAGVPAVIGMRWRVGARNNSKMVESFYTSLLGGEPSERALMFARQAIADEADWANPILTKRHGVL
jgi:hypothetical protein